jgi:hypothetical protein
VALPCVLYSTWFLLLHYPYFVEYTEPTHQYAIMFPARPLWSGGSAGGGADGEAERESMWISETYRIHVSRLQDSRFARLPKLSSQELASAINRSEGTVIVRPKADVFGVRAAAQYEQWFMVRHVVVGQVIILNDFVYEMTVTGQSLSLKDSRVQQFFDSFQRY